MENDELSAIIKRSEEDYINGWNQTRFIAYSIFQSQSSKTISPHDVLKFSWEEKPETETESTKEDLERLRKHALEMEKKLNMKNGK